MEWFRIENREKLNLEMHKGRRLEPSQNVLCTHSGRFELNYHNAYLTGFMKTWLQ